MKHVLITGGGGFIGSHLADELLARGYRVRAFDCLSQQVHGERAGRPEYLNADVELVEGDVRDSFALERALKGVDAVYHLAAAVGVGQSMYEIANYTSANNGGTAILLEALIKRPVERLVVASSMSIYGEGLYRDAAGLLVSPGERPLDRLERREWEPCDSDGGFLEPVATPESKCPSVPSIYALSKYDQERMCLTVGRAYGIPTVALRFFNVYGTRQSLSNPYTGVLAIFASRLMNDQPPLINEDGLQRRDFVSVHDVARACRLAMESADAPGLAINVGSGGSYSISDVALRLGQVLEKTHIGRTITGRYRKGDIRHCFADISLARQVLGYEPLIDFDAGLVELAEWLEGRIAVDRVEQAQQELAARGLAV